MPRIILKRKNRNKKKDIQIDREESLIIVSYVMLDQISAVLGEDSVYIYK